MTVAELLKELSKFDLDSVVILSSDAEGNNYSPLADVSKGRYEEETDYSGYIVERGGESCVVFYPVN